jgi:hypothetical protein
MSGECTTSVIRVEVLAPSVKKLVRVRKPIDDTQRIQGKGHPLNACYFELHTKRVNML